MAAKRSTKDIDPCEVCGEPVCLGSQACPVALAELVKEEDLISPKDNKPYKYKRKEIPPQIKPILKKFRISPPPKGKSEIQIYKKEEDPTLTLIRITVEGKTKSVTQTQVVIEKNTTLKFKDGILTKILFPEGGPNLIVV